MTPAEARSALASALDGAGLSATQKAQIRPAVDEYAASLIEACARSPRSQGGVRDDAA